MTALPMRPREAGPTLLFCLMGLVVSSIGCAHQSAAPEPASRDGGAQAEIATLEKKIAERKSALPGDKTESPLKSEAPTPMASGDVAGLGRCDGVCQAAQEICVCHRRICKLAGEINDDKSAESCRRSQRDCEEAGKHCATCR